MAGKVVHVGTGIVAEDAGFRLSDKPRPRSGIEGFTLLRGEHLRCAQIMSLRIGKRNGGDGRHQVLQMHDHLQPLRRVNVERLV